MLILGVNGSPRQYGNTFKLLKIALKFAEKEGADVKLVNLADLEIKPCLGCLCDDQHICRYPCVIEDDMRHLYDVVLRARGLIIATPIYWYAPSGILKNFVDRLTALENMIVVEGKSWLEGKVAGVMASGNDGGGVQAASTLMATLISMGFLIPPFAFTYYISEGDVLSDEKTLLEAANVGYSVVSAVKQINEGEKWFNVELLREVRKFKEELIHQVEEIKRRRLAKRELIFKRAKIGDMTKQDSKSPSQ